MTAGDFGGIEFTGDYIRSYARRTSRRRPKQRRMRSSGLSPKPHRLVKEVAGGDEGGGAAAATLRGSKFQRSFLTRGQKKIKLLLFCWHAHVN